MKTIERISLMAIGLLLSSIRVSAQELRIGVDYERKLPAKMELAGKLELRNALIPQKTYYTILQVGLKHEILKNLSLGGTYRHSFIPTGRSENLFESLDEGRRYTAE
jgi:hypothetical protein